MTRNSKPIIWTGRALKILLIVFMAFDASMKIIRAPLAVKASESLGLNSSYLPVLGIYMLIAAALYAIPKTAVPGAVFITAYLGGAVAITSSANLPGHPWLFPVVFCVLLWIAESLQNPGFRMFMADRRGVSYKTS